MESGIPIARTRNVGIFPQSDAIAEVTTSGDEGIIERHGSEGICMRQFTPPGLGWQHDVPDFRDFGPASPAAYKLIRKLKRSRGSLPERVDLREYCPAAYDQQGLRSSSAMACIGLVEYFERRSLGHATELSALFLYKVMRKLLRVSGDTGANLRTGLKALVGFGVPPAEFWPYDVAHYDEEPSAFHYNFGRAYQTMQYVRLDPRNASGAQTLEAIKSFVAAGFPAAFGFPVPSSISADADIPYRPSFDTVRGGQAAMVVGYDDQRLGAVKGALLIRSSWGESWGERGYGWLPYAYVKKQLAVDFWTLLRPDWLRSGEFVRPTIEL